MKTSLRECLTYLRDFVLPGPPRPKYRLEEDDIPMDKSSSVRGKPDLSYYTKPLRHYIDLYNASLQKIPKQDLTTDRVNLAWRQRVYGTWGLSVKGAEAVPYLLSLVSHENPDAREDAASLLGELRDNEEVADVLLAQLLNEKDLVAQSALIDALGKLRYTPAIPALAASILDATSDPDIRLDAVESLGRIVKQDFSQAQDRLAEAASWLSAHGYTKGSTA